MVSTERRASEAGQLPADDAELEKEVARKNFVRAAMLAQRLGRPDIEVRILQESALKQMACDYRNGPGTLALAQDWGYSKADIKTLLTTALEDPEQIGERTRSDLRYDTSTRRFLTLRQWIEKLVR